MQPLLKIQTIPVTLAVNVQYAKLEVSQTEASVDVTRDRGGFTITSDPIKLHIDSSESRASTGLKTVYRAVSEAAKRGVRLGYDGVGRIAEDGNFMMDIQIKENTIPALAARSIDYSLPNMQMAFIPATGPDISWDPPELSMSYEMDKLNFDWRTQNRPELQFIPGDIEIEVEQYSKVVIEYLGEPVYVPPSAAPGGNLEAWA
ncbi:MAG: DUF6470 family protein [Gracilibacteraceae bacterium]|jgi:hypothetical protein|nr:DUF6470 family protein [Gracilibacteraceae bacterium]